MNVTARTIAAGRQQPRSDCIVKQGTYLSRLEQQMRGTCEEYGLYPVRQSRRRNGASESL
jgi:hypothetical protein